MTTSLSDTKSKVLYVDDEDNNLFLFKTTFRKYYEIYTANSAEQGVDILRTQNIKLIITDQRMPGTSGIEFLQKTIEEYPD
ncbi:MAG: response regulator, partial [Bacteroidota bacterium]